MKLRITVTKDILKKAMMCGTPDFKGLIAENCAIALAVRDIFPEAVVKNQYIIPFHKNEDKFKNPIRLPLVAIDFIRQFDSLALINPKIRLLLPELSFEVEVSDVILKKLVNIDDIKALLAEHSTLALID